MWVIADFETGWKKLQGHIGKIGFSDRGKAFDFITIPYIASFYVVTQPYFYRVHAYELIK